MSQATGLCMCVAKNVKVDNLAVAEYLRIFIHKGCEYTVFDCTILDISLNGLDLASRMMIAEKTKLLMEHVDQVLEHLFNNHVNFSVQGPIIDLCLTILQVVVSAEDLLDYTEETRVFSIRASAQSSEIAKISFNQLASKLVGFVEEHRTFTVYALDSGEQMIRDAEGFPLSWRRDQTALGSRWLVVLLINDCLQTPQVDATMSNLASLRKLANDSNKLRQYGWNPVITNKWRFVFKQHKKKVVATISLRNSGVSYRVIDWKTRHPQFSAIEDFTEYMRALLVNTGK